MTPTRIAGSKGRSACPTLQPAVTELSEGAGPGSDGPPPSGVPPSGVGTPASDVGGTPPSNIVESSSPQRAEQPSPESMIAVVAFLAVVGHAIAAEGQRLDHTGGGAPVAIDDVSVITLLDPVHESIAAYGVAVFAGIGARARSPEARSPRCPAIVHHAVATRLEYAARRAAVSIRSSCHPHTVRARSRNRRRTPCPGRCRHPCTRRYQEARRLRCRGC